MSASFYVCGTNRRDDALDPARAIDLVKGPNKSTSLITALCGNGGIGAWSTLNDALAPQQARALLMNGTTSDLQTALEDAAAKGLKGLWVFADKLVYWGVRRKAGNETKTVILVAPFRNFVQMNDVDPQNLFPGTKRWYLMTSTTENDGVNQYSGDSISWIKNLVVPSFQGYGAWY